MESRIMSPPPKDVPVLNFITHEHVILHGKWNFADVIKVKGLEMANYLGLSKWGQSNQMSS